MYEKKDPAQALERENTTHDTPNITPTIAEVKQLLALRRDAVIATVAPTSTTPTIPTNDEEQTANTSLHRPWLKIKPFTAIPPEKPYPIEALPEVIKKAVEEVQHYIQAPLALVANSALVCLSTACQALFDVARDGNLKSPVSLFFLTIAESGERKTTCDRFFSQALIDYQEEAAKESAPALKKYQAELIGWEARQEGLKWQIKRAAQGGKNAK